MWSGRKKLACITLLNYMQDDLLIEYGVYKTTREMCEALKEKYGALSITKLSCNDFWNYKMQSNHIIKYILGR